MTVRAHQLTGRVVGLWQFDETLTDSSGNGLTLTIPAGVAPYSPIWPGLYGVRTRVARLIHDTYVPALGMVGDMTFEAILSIETIWSSTYTAATIISHHWTTGHHFDVRLTSSGLVWSSDAATFTTSLHVIPIGQIFHLAVTRRNNRIRVYINGRLRAQSTALTTPAAGDSTGRLRFGSPTRLTPDMVISSAKLIAKGLTDEQVKAEYNYVMGSQFGCV